MSHDDIIAKLKALQQTHRDQRRALEGAQDAERQVVQAEHGEVGHLFGAPRFLPIAMAGQECVVCHLWEPK